MQPILSETIYLDFITSSSTGAATDADSLPTCEVFEDGNDTAILTPTVTKRTSKTGNYRVPIACTAGNGFEVNKSYSVVASATVGGVAAKSVIGSFQVRAATTDANVTKWVGLTLPTPPHGIVDDVTATTRSFVTDLTFPADTIKGMTLRFNDPANTALWPAGAIVESFDPVSHRVTLETALPSAPVNGSTFSLLDERINLAAIAAEVAAILAGATITYTGPMTATGDAIVTIGDDYYLADARQLAWSISPSIADLSGATVVLDVPSVTGLTGAGAVTCTVLNAGASNQSVYAELSRTQTALLSVGNNAFYLKATLADTHEVTVLRDGTIVAKGRTA